MPHHCFQFTFTCYSDKNHVMVRLGQLRPLVSACRSPSALLQKVPAIKAVRPTEAQRKRLW